MDPATLVGVFLAFGSIYGAMLFEGANPTSILLPGPILLVVGGTIGAGVAGATLKDSLRAFAQVPKAFIAKAPVLDSTIDYIVSLSETARRNGMLSLEETARGIEDPFLREGIQSAIDGTDPDDLREILEDKIRSKRTSDRVKSKFFQDLGGYAPTIGIVGTVISLVHVLEQLSDPSSLGHAIAAAFVATLWGIMTANVIWLPISNRMRRISDLELQAMEVTLEGVLAVQSGANPRLVGERLRSMVDVQPSGKK